MFKDLRSRKDKVLNKVDSFIKDTFLKLTSRTYPYGYEDEFVVEMTKIGLLPKDIEKDPHGNYFYKIGESKTVFASHFDTACKDSTAITHVIDGDIIKTDGKTILGADDKAGVSIMLYMIKNKIPGLYYFFIGEEVGCVGSKLASKNGDFKGYDRIISFDRRDVGSVITHQSYSRCCSDAFADNLANELNKSGLKYKKDDTGVYTDSAEFVDVIPECTNLSVGYYKEHTHTESQDIGHLEKLAEACLLVNWESLVAKRDMTKTEYKSKSWSTTTYSSGKYNTSTFRNDSWRHASRHDTKFYGEDDDFFFDEGEVYPNRYAQERARDKDKYKQEKEKARQYYDNGELLEITQVSDTKKGKGTFKKTNVSPVSKYDWVMSKFLDEKLTFIELDIVAEQYLDMNDENDKVFYDYLVSSLNDLEFANEHGQ